MRAVSAAAGAAAVVSGRGGDRAAAAELFGTRSLLRLLRGTQQALAIAFALLVCFGVMFVVSTAIAMTIGKGAV